MEWAEAQALKKARVIIMDEATMSSKYVFEAIDHLLRDICWRTRGDIPFGGKVFILGIKVFIFELKMQIATTQQLRKVSFIQVEIGNNFSLL